jgi:replicative DNA helicase
MIHFDQNAEQNVIIALCVSHHTTQIFRELIKDDFFDGKCQKQFAWLHKAYAAGNFHEAASQAVQKGITEPSKILPVFDAVNAVRNHAIRRKMEKGIYDTTSLCRDYANPVAEVQAKFKKISVECIDSRVCRIPSKTIEDLRMFTDEVTNDTRAFITGFPDVDRMAAIQPRDFVIIGARPAVGKSALATGFMLANFLNAEQYRGIMFCMEMDRKQVYSRLISNLTGIPLKKFLNIRDYPMNQDEQDSMRHAMDTIEEIFPVRWFQQGVSTLDDIRQAVELERPDFILIDYVQIIKHKSKHGNVDRLDQISMTLRQLALELDIAVIALAQLNRDANGSQPSTSQIKGSGQFEQDATHIFLLDRPESERISKVQKRNYIAKDDSEFVIYSDEYTTNRAALSIGKNRNGPTFYQLLNFNPETTTFEVYE